eukprot:gnl/Hemi2/21282_TR7056_c0_g1_i2.p1 gnl/Hemi2/21282_TR7056_c0_g1~~gnl/Hemi2/21282_TR7056_c0_g1_i2.p1  ORF type:complete len:260 (-),score=29.91 gnl/Hemi2/21282_TR7056_c0_g1_i2:231-1010(-)
MSGQRHLPSAPTYHGYNSRAAVRDDVECKLCRRTSQDVDTSLVGELAGPFKWREAGSAKRDYFVHLNCALWAPEVYSDDSGKLFNVQQALKRGRNLTCAHCTKKGATIGCQIVRCRRSYHFPCAFAGDCEFEEDNFLISCPEHQTKEEQEGECEVCGHEGLLLCCDDCGKLYHLTCLRPPLSQIPKGRWKCGSCATCEPTCEKCGKACSERDSVACANCSAAYHTVRCLPSPHCAGWTCPNCDKFGFPEFVSKSAAGES